MAYYSFVVLTQQPVGFTKPLLILDKGVNAFTVVVDDLKDLLNQFEEEGVEVKQMNCLDEFEPNTSTDILLEGEDLLTLTGGGEVQA